MELPLQKERIDEHLQVRRSKEEDHRKLGRSWIYLTYTKKVQDFHFPAKGNGIKKHT